jgi:hypothetical protein
VLLVINKETWTMKWRWPTIMFPHIEIVHGFYVCVTILLSLLSGSIPNGDVFRLGSCCDGSEAFPVDFEQIFRSGMFLD